MSRLEDLVGLIASELADYPDLVDVTEVEHPDKTVVEVFVSPGDLGRIIGRQGRTASALRVFWLWRLGLKVGRLRLSFMRFKIVSHEQFLGGYGARREGFPFPWQ